jgi:DNA polymerase-3 subunit alpha
MAAFVFEDLESSINCVIFPKTYNDNKDHLIDSNIVFLKCEIDNSRDELQLIVNKIIPLQEAMETFTKAFVISIKDKDYFINKADSIKSAIAESKGNCPVYLKITNQKKNIAILQLSPEFNIRPNAKFEIAIKNILPEATTSYE